MIEFYIPKRGRGRRSTGQAAPCGTLTITNLTVPKGLSCPILSIRERVKERPARSTRSYTKSAMSALIIFVCSGLQIYWVARMLLLLRGSEKAIVEALERDLWWGRRFVLALRSVFVTPTLLAG